MKKESIHLIQQNKEQLLTIHNKKNVFIRNPTIGHARCVVFRRDAKIST